MEYPFNHQTLHHSWHLVFLLPAFHKSTSFSHFDFIYETDNCYISKWKVSPRNVVLKHKQQEKDSAMSIGINAQFFIWFYLNNLDCKLHNFSKSQWLGDLNVTYIWKTAMGKIYPMAVIMLMTPNLWMQVYVSSNVHVYYLWGHCVRCQGSLHE